MKTEALMFRMPVFARPFIAVLVIWVCLLAGNANAETTVIAAYQEMFRMNFAVMHKPGLPAGWFVTADGYVVAQVRNNHWVYGTSPHPGILVPTEIAVGSVVPMDVSKLARVPTSLWRDAAFNTEEFRAIINSRFDNMGVLNEPMAYTPIVWRDDKPEVQVWLGERWFTIIPTSGQTTSQAVASQRFFISRILNERNASWTMSDTQELADLARTWGFLWHGHVSTRPRLSTLPRLHGAGGGDSAIGGIGGGLGGGGGGGSDGGWDVGN